MFKTGKNSTAGGVIQIVPYFHDRRQGFGNRAVELKANGACEIRHSMQNESRRRDDPVATFFLYTWQPTKDFVGDVLAKSLLAELPAGNFQ